LLLLAVELEAGVPSTSPVELGFGLLLPAVGVPSKSPEAVVPPLPEVLPELFVGVVEAGTPSSVATGVELFAGVEFDAVFEPAGVLDEAGVELEPEAVLVEPVDVAAGVSGAVPPTPVVDEALPELAAGVLDDAVFEPAEAAGVDDEAAGVLPAVCGAGEVAALPAPVAGLGPLLFIIVI